MDLTTMSSWLIIAEFAVLGLCIGSFVNVVCYRLPIIRGIGPYADGKKLQELMAKHGRYSLALPCSACPSCDAPIRPIYNIPVIGWLMLRGKCSSCGSRISAKYPAVELLFGFAFAAYVAIQGIWPAGLLTLPMMAIAFCALSIRIQTGRFVAPLLWGYAFALVAQAVLTHFGYSAYAA